MRTEGRRNFKKGSVIRIKNHRRLSLSVHCVTGRCHQEINFTECIRRMPEIQARVLSVVDVEDNTESSKRQYLVFRIQE